MLIKTYSVDNADLEGLQVAHLLVGHGLHLAHGEL
jgi:hypothetical protein